MKRHGFTLIEILIVITVIAILATMAVGAYGLIRVNMAIDLQADKVVAQFHTLRAEAQTQANCIGMRFKTGEYPQMVYVPYIQRQRICEVDSANKRIVPMSWPPDISVDQMYMNADTRDTEIIVWFVPPEGKLKLENPADVLDVMLKIQRGSQVRCRQVSISAASETIEKSTPNTEAGSCTVSQESTP